MNEETASGLNKDSGKNGSNPTTDDKLEQNSVASENTASTSTTASKNNNPDESNPPTNENMSNSASQLVQDSEANTNSKVTNLEVAGAPDKINPFQNSSDDETSIASNEAQTHQQQQENYNPKLAATRAQQDQNKEQDGSDEEKRTRKIRKQRFDLQKPKRKPPAQCRQSARKSTGGKAPRGYEVTKAGKAIAPLIVPRPVTGDDSLEEDLIDSFDMSILKSLDDGENIDNIKQKTEDTFNQFVEKYNILKQCKYMLHTVQFKQGVLLKKSTNMPLKFQGRKSQYKKFDDMIASHHYYISTQDSPRTKENFHKTFFELDAEYMKRFLQAIKSKIENNRISTRQTNRETEPMIELKKMHHHLTNNYNSLFVNQWIPIAELAMPIWEKKLTQDEKVIQDRFAVPIAISYF